MSLYKWICEKRLLTAQICMLRSVVEVRILASYSSITHIFYLWIKLFGINILSFDVSSGWGSSRIPAPKIVVALSVFSLQIINTGKSYFDALHSWTNGYMKEREVAEKENKRLIEKAKEFGL